MPLASCSIPKCLAAFPVLGTTTVCNQWQASGVIVDGRQTILSLVVVAAARVPNGESALYVRTVRLLQSHQFGMTVWRHQWIVVAQLCQFLYTSGRGLSWYITSNSKANSVALYAATVRLPSFPYGLAMFELTTSTAYKAVTKAMCT